MMDFVSRKEKVGENDVEGKENEDMRGGWRVNWGREN
jgi:hypothetical protein